MIVRWVLLALPTALGFGVVGPSQHLSSAKHLQTRSASRTSIMQESELDQSQFYDYDKPVVILGCGGQGQEVKRAADAIVEALEIRSAGVLSLASFKDDLSTSLDDLALSIDRGEYSWPNVVLVDFSDELASSQGSLAVKKYQDFAKRMYEAGLLSIYVNVDSASSKMSPTLSERKEQLEQDVFVKYSDYEVCVKGEGISDNEDDWEHIQWEMMRILARARLVPAVPGAKTPASNTAYLTMGDHTFFLSLSFPDIAQVEPYVEEMCQDVDAMEYRADLLDCRDSRFDLLYGMQQLRRFCRPFAFRAAALPFAGHVVEDVMPIVYTVRTQNQAGTYPDDDEGISKMFEMLEWGLRGGVEVLDVESAWDPAKTSSLLSLAKSRYSSQILGSHHVVGEEISTEAAVRLFQQCALDGRAHGAKVVLSVETDDKARMAHEAALIASSLAAKEGKPDIPNISLVLGDVGSFSRIVNIPFTPVTHESLPFKAAPGQMTANQILAARILCKILTTRRYVILGHNISYSVSPQMQGSAFSAARLPYQYGMADVETVEELVESDFFKSAMFGGASVTIPHKQAIIPYVDVLSESAKAIGSVNTLIAKTELSEDVESFERVIYGDNTDWQGIYHPLQRKLGSSSAANDDSGYCLIIGGGGTARAAAYAARELGLKRLYYNRTPSKAAELADVFGGSVIYSLDETSASEEQCLGTALPSPSSLKVVISTLPAAVGFTLPDWLFSSEGSSPIVFDVNYKPYSTKLLEQAEEFGCDVVRGSEMLWEQGVRQFELWTKRTAPYAVMKTVVLQNCLPSEDSVDHDNDLPSEDSADEGKTESEQQQS